MRVAVIFALLAILAINVSAQTCVNYTAISNVGGTYTNLIGKNPDYLVYVPAGSTIADLESANSLVHLIISTIETAACRNAYSRFMAARIMAPCPVFGGNTLNSAGPRLTCRSECTAAATACTGVDAAKITALVSSFSAGSASLAALVGSGFFSNCAATPSPLVPTANMYPVSTYAAGPLTLSCYALPNTATTAPASPSCQAFNTAPLNSSSFVGVIPASQNTYIPVDATLGVASFAALETQASALMQLVNGISTAPCREAVARLLGSKVFMTCDAGALTNHLRLPSFPCNSMCTNVTSICPAAELGRLNVLLAQFAGALGKPSLTQLFNCSAIGGVISGVADYPATTTAFGPGLSSTCSSISASVSLKYSQCVKWSDIPGSSTSVVNGVVDPNAYIYLPSAVSAAAAFTFLESKVSSVGTILSGIWNLQCREAVARLFASKVYMKCHEATRPAGLFFPRLPCQSACTTLASVCPASDFTLLAGLLASGGAPLDCSAVGGVLPGLPDYPTTTTPIMTGIATQCTTLSGAAADVYNPLPVDYSSFSVGTCVEYTGTVCRGVISGQVYMPKGYCQQNIEDQLVLLPSLFAATSNNCAAAAANLMCNMAFPKCFNLTAVPGASPLPVPSMPSTDLCVDMHSNCPGYKFVTAVSNLAPNQITSEADMVGNKKWGLIPDMSKDGNVLNMLLGTNYVNSSCTSFSVGTNTFLFSRTFYNLGGGAISPANPGAPLANVKPVKPQCVAFNSDAIVQATRALVNTDPDFKKKVDAFNARTNRPNKYDEPDLLFRSYCKGVIPEGQLVYIPAGSNMTYLNDQARKVHWLFALASKAEGCSIAFAKYMCGQIFNKCNTDLVQVTFPSYFPFMTYLGNPLLPGTLKDIYRPFFNALPASLQFLINLPVNGSFAGAAPYTLTAPSAFPSFPCKSVCQDYKSKCAAWYGPLDSAILTPDCERRALAPSGPLPAEYQITNCDGTTKSKGQVDFPVPTFNGTAAGVPVGPGTACPVAGANSCGGTYFAAFSLGASTVDGPFGYLNQLALSVGVRSNCNPMSESMRQSDIPFVCPYPIVDPRLPDPLGRVPANPDAVDTISNGGCAVPCPNIALSDAEYNMLTTLISISTCISFPLLVWMASTWLIFPEKRGQRYILYFNISVFLVNCSVFMGVVNGVRYSVCQNGVERTKFDLSVCTFQAALIQWASVSAVGWWLVQAFDLWLKVVLEWKPTKRAAEVKENIYHFMNWVYPSVNVLVAGVHGGFAYGGSGLAWCFTWYEDVTWACYFVPIFIYSVFGIFFMMMIVFSVCQSSIRSSGSAFKKGAWMVHLRPILFISIFTVVWVVIFSFRFYTATNSDMLSGSTAQWIVCYFVTQPTRMFTSGDFTSECSARPDKAVSMDFFLSFYTVVGLLGPIVFLLYGTMEDNFKLWKGLLGCRVKTGRSRYEGQSQADSKAGSVAGSVAASRKGSSVSTHSGSKIEVSSK